MRGNWGEEMVRAVSQLYKHLGLPGAGLIFMLEGIGVPIPVEIPLGIVGLRMVRGESTYWEIVLLMWLSTVLGNTIGYVLGYYGGRPLALKLVSLFRITPDLWHKAESWFKQHGLKVVLATRWINWGFAQNMWLCGITQVPFGRFFVVMVVNDFLWAMAWTWVARTAVIYLRRAGAVFAFLHTSTQRVALITIGVVLLVMGIWFLLRRKNGSAGGPGGPNGPNPLPAEEVPTEEGSATTLRDPSR